MYILGSGPRGGLLLHARMHATGHGASYWRGYQQVEVPSLLVPDSRKGAGRWGLAVSGRSGQPPSVMLALRADAGLVSALLEPRADRMGVLSAALLLPSCWLAGWLDGCFPMNASVLHKTTRTTGLWLFCSESASYAQVQ